MISTRTIVASLSLSLLVAVAPAGAAIYTGSLATNGTSDGQLVAYSGSPSWGTGTVLTWTVDTGYAPGLVSYTYTLTAANMPAAGISHMIFELTGQPNPFTTTDLVSTNVAPGTLEFGQWAPNPGSPNLPSTLANGVKYTPGTGEKTATLQLVTGRLPMWGDFYARGGQTNQVWNAGFGTAAQEADSTSAYFDPTDAAANGSIRDHLLVPNSHSIGNAVRVVKFFDANGDGIHQDDEPLLGAGWEFEVSGGNLQSPVHLVTNASGVTEPVSLSDGISYVVTELNIPGGWTQTTNSGNPITFMPSADNSTVMVGNIPEPATLSMVALGALGLIARRRRA